MPGGRPRPVHNRINRNSVPAYRIGEIRKAVSAIRSASISDRSERRNVIMEKGLENARKNAEETAKLNRVIDRGERYLNSKPGTLEYSINRLLKDAKPEHKVEVRNAIHKSLKMGLSGEYQINLHQVIGDVEEIRRQKKQLFESK